MSDEYKEGTVLPAVPIGDCELAKYKAENRRLKDSITVVMNGLEQTIRLLREIRDA